MAPLDPSGDLRRSERRAARAKTFADIAPTSNTTTDRCGPPFFLHACPSPPILARDCDGYELLGDTYFDGPRETGRRYRRPLIPRKHIHPEGLTPTPPSQDLLDGVGESASDGALRVELVRSALDVITANLDIVEWLGCILAPRLGECLVEHFRDEVRDPFGGKRIRLGFDAGGNRQGLSFDFPPSWLFWLFGIPMASLYSRLECDIHLPVSDDVEYWRWYIEWSHDPASAAAKGHPSIGCIAVMLASTIVHEMTHCCMWESGIFGADVPFACFPTYRIKAAFLWAMSQRYPCDLGPGSGCEAYLDDEYFGFDGAIGL